MKLIKTIMTGLGFWLVIILPVAGQRAVEGSGYILTQQRAMPPFNGIEISRELKAFIVEGPHEPLTVEADDNLFPYIHTEVQGGILRIFVPDSIQITRYAVMNILISMPDVQWLRAGAAARINGPSHPWKLKAVFLETDETAGIKLHTNAESLTIKANSYSYVELKGAAGRLNANLQTNASLYGRELEATEANADLSTGAEARIGVKARISYRVGEDCTLIIRGTPNIIKPEVASGGKVVHEK